MTATAWSKYAAYLTNKHLERQVLKRTQDHAGSCHGLIQCMRVQLRPVDMIEQSKYGKRQVSTTGN